MRNVASPSSGTSQRNESQVSGAGRHVPLRPAATQVTCAAAVTEGQAVRDLEASLLPVLAYRQEPADGEFKQLAMFGDVALVGCVSDFEPAKVAEVFA